METYCIVIMSLGLIGLILEDSGGGRLSIVASFCMYLPLYGRIFGWW